MELDFTKEVYLYELMSEVWSWEDEAESFLQQVEARQPPPVTLPRFARARSIAARYHDGSH